jgi:hypothetical protein
MSTSTQLAMTRQNLNDAWWCEALFASGLQPSDAPTADMVAAAINRTLQQLGVLGCVGQMAQEFGDHPDAAARRMRWVHGLTEVALAVTQAIAVPQAATTMAGSVRLSWLSRELSPARGSPPALAECGGAVALGSTGSASGSGSVRPMRPRKEMATHV